MTNLIITYVRASTLVEANFLLFGTTKSHFIYFNLPFHNSLHINGLIFTPFIYLLFFLSLHLYLSIFSPLSTHSHSQCHQPLQPLQTDPPPLTQPLATINHYKLIHQPNPATINKTQQPSKKPIHQQNPSTERRESKMGERDELGWDLGLGSMASGGRNMGRRLGKGVGPVRSGGRKKTNEKDKSTSGLGR